MINWRALCLTMLVSLAPCALCTNAQSSKAFHWINRQRDAALWADVQKAFRSQLKSELDYPQLNYGYLARIGVVDGAALVIIGHSAGTHPKRDWQGIRRFSAYNYNLATRSRSEIAGVQYVWFWKFVGLAKFDSSATPDVTFTYYDCWECEGDEILAALYYEPSLGKWKLRPWKTGGPADSTIATGLIVHADSEPDDQAISNDSLYGLVDLSGNGVDEVALRIREVTEPVKGKRHVDDWTTVYSMSRGQFSGRSVTRKQEQVRVWSKLCAKSTNKLCKDVSTRQ